jgi:hypothetical protein
MTSYLGFQVSFSDKTGCRVESAANRFSLSLCSRMSQAPTPASWAEERERLSKERKRLVDERRKVQDALDAAEERVFQLGLEMETLKRGMEANLREQQRLRETAPAAGAGLISIDAASRRLAAEPAADIKGGSPPAAVADVLKEALAALPEGAVGHIPSTAKERVLEVLCGPGLSTVAAVAEWVKKWRGVIPMPIRVCPAGCEVLHGFNVPESEADIKKQFADLKARRAEFNRKRLETAKTPEAKRAVEQEIAEEEADLKAIEEADFTVDRKPYSRVFAAF